MLDGCLGTPSCGESCIGGITYFIPGICYYGGNGTNNVYQSAYCNGTNSIIALYYEQDTCNNDSALLTASSDECGYFTDISAIGSTFTVYAQVGF